MRRDCTPVQEHSETLIGPSAAAAVLGATTVKEMVQGGSVEPLQECLTDVLLGLVTGEGEVNKRIGQALFDYRYSGPNKGNPKKLVDKNNVINEHRLMDEYHQIVNKGPASIRWALAYGKLNLQTVDHRLLEEVTQRPNLPDAVKAHVKVLLREMAKRIQSGDYDSDDDDE